MGAGAIVILCIVVIAVAVGAGGGGGGDGPTAVIEGGEPSLSTPSPIQPASPVSQPSSSSGTAADTSSSTPSTTQPTSPVSQPSSHSSTYSCGPPPTGSGTFCMKDDTPFDGETFVGIYCEEEGVTESSINGNTCSCSISKGSSLDEGPIETCMSCSICSLFDGNISWQNVLLEYDCRNLGYASENQCRI